MNQTTPSLRWLNSKPKYMNRKMNSHPHTMTLESGVLNVYIIVCSGFVIHRLMKCISSQSLNHHTGRDQSLLILTVCVWNKERLFLLSLSHSKRNISLVVSFLAWINFLSWKILTMITSHTRGKWKFQLKKMMKKLWESQKGKRAQKTQTLGGIPKSQETMIAKTKWICPGQHNEKGQIKEEWQKKRWKTQIVELLIVILGLWNLETLFEPYESFSFIAKNHSLHYVHVEVLSNQASNLE